MIGLYLSGGSGLEYDPQVLERQRQKRIEAAVRLLQRNGYGIIEPAKMELAEQSIGWCPWCERGPSE